MFLVNAYFFRKGTIYICPYCKKNYAVDYTVFYQEHGPHLFNFQKGNTKDVSFDFKCILNAFLLDDI